MAITFHCAHCGKKIEAQDRAGGKWGKCPGCHNRIYVPDVAVDEDLKLAPIDESDEERKRQLMAETYKVTQDILQEREIPTGAEEPLGPPLQIGDKELNEIIVTYLRSMADGELDRAEEIADIIVPFGARAGKMLDKIALSEMPEPELAAIPSQVLAGLIRNLRARIG